MKNLAISILGCLMVASIISCKEVPDKDALPLYAELDRSLDPNTIGKNEIEKGWDLLFDGISGEGWHGYNMTGFPECWMVEDGALTMNSVGGQEDQDIITNKKYRSFAFGFDFKMTPGANSGIIYQIEEDTAYKFPYETGPEFQVIDQENWPDTLEDWQILGANYAMYPPVARPFKPVGEWNSALLVVDGNNVTQVLNGEITVQYEKYSEDWKKKRESGKWVDYPDYGKFDEGFISLQNHGTKVWYRNLKIKEL
ncbi:MAG TPA: DUF1080 domain-containing protein [Bacteroidales bacterium]|nr:DUF1080 domain-containing protein [Bacteroidales bacterium]